MNTTNHMRSKMKQATNKTSLMGRTSTAALAAFGILSGGSAQADCFDPGPLNSVNISTPQDCVVIDDPIANNVNVNADVSLPYGGVAFQVYNTTVGGRVQNNALIYAGSGIAFLAYGDAEIVEGVTNTGRIESDTSAAMLLKGWSTIGGIVNSGEISGIVGIDGTEGVVITEDILNEEDALIHGDDIGIRIDADAYFYGDIVNEGTIEGAAAGIELSLENFYGAIINERDGIIRTDIGTPTDTGIAIHITSGVSYAGGGLTNHGLLEGAYGAYLFEGDEYFGDISNTGQALASFDGAIVIGGGTTESGDFRTSRIDTNFSNAGLIDGGTGPGVLFSADYVGSSEGAPTLFQNSGSILSGVELFANEISINIRNTRSGVISGGITTALLVEANDIKANLTNSGLIEGTAIGVRIQGDALYFEGKGASVGGDSLVGAESYGFIIPSTFSGDVHNRGTIIGSSRGLTISANSISGGINNEGTIIGGSYGELETLYYVTESVGLRIGDYQTEASYEESESSGSSMTGLVRNSGLIQGGSGVVIDLDTFEATDSSFGFSNSGIIEGATAVGVSIVAVESWYGDIFNSGSIHGADTGFYFYGKQLIGNFINDGHISGGQLTTGVHLTGSLFSGDFINNDLIDAPGNALHLEFTSIDGSVTNHGSILATSYGGTAALLKGYYGSGTISGALTNTGLIEGGDEGIGVRVDGTYFEDGIRNVGGTIRADIAVDTRTAAYGEVIENLDGGLIDGDVYLSQYYGDLVKGIEGTIRGHIYGGPSGEVNDDAVAALYGTSYLVGGAHGLQTLAVDHDGVLVLGTETMGVGGAGFIGDEIGEVSVGSTGRIYLSDNAELETHSFVQEAYGETTFFLTSDTGTHGQIRNPDTSGTVNLAGTISVKLDFASFAGNPNTQFTYEDVIVAGSRNGTFSNDSVIGSHFFELDVDYDDFTEVTVEEEFDTVDLLLTRASFSSLSCSTSTQNIEQIGEMLEQSFRNGELSEEQLELYLAILSSSDACEAASMYEDLSGTPFDFIAFQLDGPFKKMVGARIDSGRSTGCVVAGTTGCFSRYAADTTAGSTVMNDGTPGEDPFAWLRSGVRSAGSSAVWGRGVGVWGETDGDGAVGAPGSRYNQKGAILGVDHVFSETFIAGLAGQFTDTDIKFPGHIDKVKVGSWEAGAYLSWGDTQGYLNANASYIWHNFDASRQIGGSPTKGQFDGGSVSAYLEGGKIYEAGDWRLQPTVALSIMSLSTDGYTENGASPNRLVVKDSGFDSLKSIIGGRFAYPIELNSGRRLVPEVRASWSHEYLDNSAQFDARLFSFAEDPASYFTTNGAEYDRDALILGTGLNAPISDKIVLYLDYDASLASDQTSQTASGGMRILW